MLNSGGRRELAGAGALTRKYFSQPLCKYL